MTFSALAAMSLLAAASAPGGPMPIGKAIAAAEAETGARALDADLDTLRSGRLVYEIELSDGERRHEVRIDAATGEIVGKKSSKDALIGTSRSVGEDWTAVKDGQTLASAIEALEAETGGRVLDAQFDIEAGQARYELEISTPAGVTDIYLDPATGKRLVAVYED